MREGNAVIAGQEQLECKVTKRSGGSERIGKKVCLELERLGVSTEILECLWKAQENRQNMQKTK